MKTSELSAVREELVLELHSVAAEGSSSAEVIERFKKKSAHLVKNATEALVDIGLMQILNQLRARKTPISATAGHPDLFLSTYGGPRIFSVQVEGQAARLNIKLKDMTCDQLQDWCLEHGKLRDTKDKQVREAERMLKEVLDFRASAETTVGEALDLAQAWRKDKESSG